MFKFSKDGVSVYAMLDVRGKDIKDDPKRECPIKICVTFRRTQKYFGTGKYLTTNEWGELPFSKKPALRDVRMSVGNSFDLIRAAVEDLAYRGSFSLDKLTNRLKATGCDTVNAAFKAKIAELRESGRIGNMMVYNNVLQGLERFAGTNIGFDLITEEWLRHYEKFLKSEGKTTATVGFHMRHLRAIIKKAIRDGIVKQDSYPFGRDTYVIQSGKGRKMALTLEQVGKVARFDNGREATKKHRDYWMFLYLCNGLNVADFVKLKYSNIENGEIFFIRQKTERTSKEVREIRIVVTEPMQRIIDEYGNELAPDNYIFPTLTGNETPMDMKQKTKYLTRAINKHMAIIGKELGIGTISTYTARHSFATVLKRSGSNVAYISEALGHDSQKTTESYLASFEREERVKNAKLLTNFETYTSNNK